MISAGILSFKTQRRLHGVEQIGLVSQTHHVRSMWTVRRDAQLCAGMFHRLFFRIAIAHHHHGTVFGRQRLRQTRCFGIGRDNLAGMRVVSGDQFISDRAVKDRILAQFGGMCTEMEGAAIAQAAYLNKIPFVIIRAISDKADDSAGMDYAAFEAQAIKHSVNLLLEMASRYEA